MIMLIVEKRVELKKKREKKVILNGSDSFHFRRNGWILHWALQMKSLVEKKKTRVKNFLIERKSGGKSN